MKKIKRVSALILIVIVLVSVLGVTTTCSGAKSSYKEIFEKDKIIDVNINIDENDLNDMYNYARNEEYHSADITVDGITVENAGIRTKGNMTLNSVAASDSDRYSFRIKFNKYVKGNKLLGLDELCLNNGYSDPSYMREYLHYETLRSLGMKVPETVFARVYINGGYAGLYLAAEGIDDTFLKSNFGADYNEGNLYKMDEGSTLEYEEDETYGYADLKSGNDTELEDFKAFVKKLNAMPDGEKGEIENVLDVDSALKYIASNTVLCNYDSYNGNMHHNYYLYEDKNGIFTVIPWDFNMSFGGFNGSNPEVGIDTPYISGSLETLPLIGKLLSVPEYKEKYYDYIKIIMDTLANFEDRVEGLKDIIAPYVKEDTTAFYSYDEFEKATSKVQTNDISMQMSSSVDKARKDRFGGGNSIINCVIDRLENLKKQFSGEAETSTGSSKNNNGFGNGDRGSGQPPRMNDGSGQPPRMNDGSGQPPQMNDDNGKKFVKEVNKQESSDIRVHVNGHLINSDAKPYMDNNSVFVGLRSILETLGAEVSWDETNQSVTAVRDDMTISFTIGSKEAYVNGEKYELTAAPSVSEDTTMIPVRFIAEMLGMKVSWEDSGRLVVITSK